MRRAVRNAVGRLLRPLFATVDGRYARRHDLEACGMLLLCRVRHRGLTVILEDGTRIDPGDPVGSLHFDNALIARARQGESGRAAALRFRRLLLPALSTLAHKFDEDPDWAEVRACTGITWLLPHGQALGFQAEPLGPGLRRLLLACHFRLLLLAWYPQGSGAGVIPHRFWLSRRALERGLERVNA